MPRKKKTQSEDPVTRDAYSNLDADWMKKLQPEVRRMVQETFRTLNTRRQALGELVDVADPIYWALKEGKSYDQLPEEVRAKVPEKAYRYAQGASQDHGFYTGHLVGALASKNNKGYGDNLQGAFDLEAKIREPQAVMQEACYTRAVM